MGLGGEPFNGLPSTCRGDKGRLLRTDFSHAASAFGSTPRQERLKHASQYEPQKTGLPQNLNASIGDVALSGHRHRPSPNSASQKLMDRKRCCARWLNETLPLLAATFARMGCLHRDMPGAIFGRSLHCARRAGN